MAIAISIHINFYDQHLGNLGLLCNIKNFVLGQSNKAVDKNLSLNIGGAKDSVGPPCQNIGGASAPLAPLFLRLCMHYMIVVHW